MLRRKGIYGAQLASWRQRLAEAGQSALDGRKPGPTGRDTRQRDIEKLERKNKRLEHELMVARKLLDLAGKAHEILGVALPSLEDDGKR